MGVEAGVVVGLVVGFGVDVGAGFAVGVAFGVVFGEGVGVAGGGVITGSGSVVGKNVTDGSGAVVGIAVAVGSAEAVSPGADAAEPPGARSTSNSTIMTTNALPVHTTKRRRRAATARWFARVASLGSSIFRSNPPAKARSPLNCVFMVLRSLRKPRRNESSTRFAAEVFGADCRTAAGFAISGIV